MLQALYTTKKELKSAVGKSLNYLETSLLGLEYRSTGTFTVTNLKRTWFATVTMKDDKIASVK